MNKEEAQLKALEGYVSGIAIVFTQDNVNWHTAWHNESRYLETSVKGCLTAKEIWIYGKHGNKEWVCYKSLTKLVDYVQETGATGSLASILQTVQTMHYQDTLEELSPTELGDVLKQLLDEYDKENK